MLKNKGKVSSKNWNRSIAGAFAVLLSMSVFAGCSNSASTKSEGATSKQSSKEETKPTQGVTTLKLGHVFAPDSLAQQGAKKFAELVNEKSGGKVKIDLFPSGQLGGDKQLVDSLKTDVVDMAIIGETAFSMAAPKYEGLATPYLFNDINHLHKVLAGPIGDEIKAEFKKNMNSTLLDFWDRNPRNLTANKEIKTPDDLKGIKLRVPEIPLYVQSWKALGVNPTVLAWPETFSALESKAIDGQENPLDLIYSTKLNEVQKYIMLTEHVNSPIMLFVNDKKLASFPQDIQKAIKDASIEAGTYQKDLVQKAEKDYLEKLQANGMKVVNVDKGAFQKKLQDANVTKQFEDKWAPNLIQRIRDTK